MVLTCCTAQNGYFYTFANEAVHIINPTTMSVAKTLTVDSNGAPLTNNGSSGGNSTTSRTWNDVVYAEVLAESGPCRVLRHKQASDELTCVQSAALNKYYVCVNEGDIYSNGTQEYSYVSCIDTVTQQVGCRHVQCSCERLYHELQLPGLHLACLEQTAPDLQCVRSS